MLDAAPLGLIAGDGVLPILLARAARARGRRVCAIGFPGLTNTSLADETDSYECLALGQVGLVVEAFGRAGVTQAIVAGKVPKAYLYEKAAELELDALASEALAALADRKDDSILGAVAEVLNRHGVELRPQLELAPELLAPEGPLGALSPTPGQRADIALGFEVARALGALDIGQTVVVKEGAVLAVEAIEGTDAAIRRGGTLAGGEGACVVKVAKPGQDPRFDIPVVGPSTLESLRESGARVLALEAGATVVLEREVLVSAADACGIVLVGVGEGVAARSEAAE